ncbi:Spl2p NDAI_0B04540 [Naumovozyma dairenensis CBS 421]|uniref:Uncharacterized protein n=1 Tax=Naumovozyma dairenensis (strain ATCC 10597 / BCRC 20456 / CBS 421 / NBRC 0211 / NRRL Y-12639) TaxID=1071378 RepID=G0W6S8_NAUDC|nr:hypothetical protein NDAI_0B04540 [Naumovozyma dairenensis CBS 421]CCD23489.1 hypothetical protein NDAI_0B04540 [Naumovozyma dairenensis CBS 421]
MERTSQTIYSPIYHYGDNTKNKDTKIGNSTHLQHELQGQINGPAYMSPAYSPRSFNSSNPFSATPTPNISTKSILSNSMKHYTIEPSNKLRKHVSIDSSDPFIIGEPEQLSSEEQYTNDDTSTLNMEQREQYPRTNSTSAHPNSNNMEYAPTNNNFKRQKRHKSAPINFFSEKISNNFHILNPARFHQSVSLAYPNEDPNNSVFTPYNNYQHEKEMKSNHYTTTTTSKHNFTNQEENPITELNKLSDQFWFTDSGVDENIFDMSSDEE